jgi:hypothetical protein
MKSLANGSKILKTMKSIKSRGGPTIPNNAGNNAGEVYMGNPSYM